MDTGYKVSSTFVPEDTANFYFPVPTKLESERVLLVPLDPSKHAEPFLASCDTGMCDHIPMRPFSTTQEFTEKFQKMVEQNPAAALFAIIDKTSERFAGLIGYINTLPNDFVTEIGCVLILPEFRRTYITSNAVGILLHYALDVANHGGLGLRRVEWRCNSNNLKSLEAAKRMGFTVEGILRWVRVMRPAQEQVCNGIPRRIGDPQAEYPSRDTALLSICWDDWDFKGVREEVDIVMSRRA